MTEEQRVLLQILELHVRTPELNLAIKLYPNTVYLEGMYDDEGNETIGACVTLHGKNTANDLHRLFEHLKELKEQL